jgi:hypothetical protein
MFLSSSSLLEHGVWKNPVDWFSKVAAWIIFKEFCGSQNFSFFSLYVFIKQTWFVILFAFLVSRGLNCFFFFSQFLSIFNLSSYLSHFPYFPLFLFTCVIDFLFFLCVIGCEWENKSANDATYGNVCGKIIENSFLFFKSFHPVSPSPQWS